MIWVALALVFTHAVVALKPLRSQNILRIVGGEVTTIDRYPFQAAILYSTDYFYRHYCGGSILTDAAILSAAHCFWFDRDPNHYRVRVGSNFANAGGVVYNITRIVMHPNYNFSTLLQGSDVVVLHTGATIAFTSVTQPATIAGNVYHIEDDAKVWATGWGVTTPGNGTGPSSEQLRHVQLRTINQWVCSARYGAPISHNMLCAGDLQASKGQCLQDSGGPLLHDVDSTLVLVGISSWGSGCGDPYFPGINTRVSKFHNWIAANLYDRNPQLYRTRVGSSFANAGGVVYTTSQIIQHPDYSSITHDSDLVIIRSDGVIMFNEFVMPAAIAGTNYNLQDNEAVWAVGWGLTQSFGSPSETLRRVQLRTINQDICRSRITITSNMLCAGALDIGGKGACEQDTGGPIVHNGVIVGIISRQNGCGNSYYPDVNTRVSNFTSWIQANA